MDSDAVTTLIGAVSALKATRYFTIIGCVLLLWDHLLTFKDEIKYIWALPMDLTKLVFVFNRYVVAGSICWSVYILLELRAPLSWEICHIYILYTTSTSMVAVAIANLTVIFHIQVLWEKRPIVSYVLLVGFVITYGVTVVCSGFTLQDFQSHIIWVPELNSCAIPHKPMALIGVWGGMVTFDLFMLGMVFTNAVDRPYRETSEIVRKLHKDGLKFFIVLLIMRVINLLISIFTTTKLLMVIVFFSWAIVSITLSRFLIMIKAGEEAAAKETSDLVTPAAGATLWRNNSGYWSRECDLIELKSTSRSSR